jgi:hypothetical protein
MEKLRVAWQYLSFPAWPSQVGSRLGMKRMPATIEKMSDEEVFLAV